MEDKGKLIRHLNDHNWACKFTFMADIMEHQCHNKQLQKEKPKISQHFIYLSKDAIFEATKIWYRKSGIPFAIKNTIDRINSREGNKMPAFI